MENNVKDIVINGVSLNSLKQMKQDIRQGASKFIAKAIEQGNKLIKQLIEVESVDDVEEIAKQALQVYQNIEMVSGLSGVTFYLPYSEEYREDDGILSLMVLQENDEPNPFIEVHWGGDQSISKLYELLDSMESTCRAWHSSNC